MPDKRPPMVRSGSPLTR